MKLSVKEDKKQASEHKIMAPKVMYLLAISHLPLLENEGIMASNAKTVPVGSRFERLAESGSALWADFGEALVIANVIGN